jgi:uracil-DNA glycosylase family 4
MFFIRTEEEIRNCRKCSPIFSKRFVDPLAEKEVLLAKPIVSSFSNHPVMLVGQAPGISEYRKEMAFQGQAGKDIRSIFTSLGVPKEEFDSTVYQTSITKCFPGRKTVKRKDGRVGAGYLREEDRVPSTQEIENCIPFLKRQVELIKPRVIVLLGGVAIKGYLRLRNRLYNGDLVSYVGQKESWGQSTIIFFPHTSGSSRWLNQQGNRNLFEQAKSLLRVELRKRGIVI